MNNEDEHQPIDNREVTVQQGNYNKNVYGDSVVNITNNPPETKPIEPNHYHSYYSMYISYINIQSTQHLDTLAKKF